MENRTDKTDETRSPGEGIRLSHLNVILIMIGLVIALFMVFSMYQTNNSFNQIVSVTEAYLSAQQTTGMLNSISSGMSEQCAAFLDSGDPGMVHIYAGQLYALTTQIESNEAFQQSEGNQDEFLAKALQAFRAMTAMEIHAMRLMADTLPKDDSAYPLIIQQYELSAEDRVLSPEEKKAAALSLVRSEEYRSLGTTIAQAVDDSHRLASEKGKNQAQQTAESVRKIMLHQIILVSLFVLVAVAALLLNWILIISPIRRCVEKLDRSELLPVRGSYEVRHLANVYNEVLKDNIRKTAALSYAADHDALTGLCNRASFDKAYKVFEKDKVGIMVADVDYFKQYNDEFGHDTGDRVLKAVADKLKEHFRPEDHISRIGGDEFCIIMPGMSQAQAASVTDRIRQINQELRESMEGFPPITISAGFAFWDRPEPKEGLFQDADSMLLQVKKARTDCCAVYPG